jgi:protoheme IX farnesyltransferase
MRAQTARLPAAVRLADLVELTKPRITLMVVLTAAAGFLVAGAGPVPAALLLGTLVGTGLLAAGASALNQVLERDTDARMKRTADRPLPAGRLDPDAALVFGVGLGVAGLLLLALRVNLLTALLGALTLGGYLFVYTPLKRLTSLATVVGAVPGAMPPLMGWAAQRDALDPAAWSLFGLLFLWQLPHFLAIAWLYRADYARAGFPMLPVLDPEGDRTARQMILYAAALVPVSVLPSVLGLTGVAYFAGSLALGVALLACCLAFAASRSAGAARRLMLASVLYLPAVLVVLVLDRAARS